MHYVLGAGRPGPSACCPAPTRHIIASGTLEGFFGRLKIEFFHGCDWTGAALEEFTDMLDAYLRWYRDVRIKGDLDYRSPMQYRRDLGLLAA